MKEETKCNGHYGTAGCGYCSPDVYGAKGEELVDNDLTIENRIRQETLKEVLDYLQEHYLNYCKEQNGMDYCKNCGLEVEQIIKHFKVK